MNKKAFHYFLYENEELISAGGSKQQISGLVVCYKYDSSIAASEQDLLSKIVSAIGFNMDSAQCFNIGKDSIQITDIKNAILLCFGAVPEGLVSSQKYELDQNSGNKLILSDSLEELSTNIDLKHKLWSALKSLN